jgi:FtsP/CotA-like multicopper oxidase with cupredoxin domain
MLSRRRLLIAAGGALAASHRPARAQGVVNADQPRSLRAMPADHLTGNALGYDGKIPGPVLRVRRGGELSVRLVNELSEATTIHWHGLRVPNAMDGVPMLTQAAVAPATSFEYRFRPPDAGTYWYHAHEAGQLQRGLFGALIVEESQAIDVDGDLTLVLSRPDANGAPLVNGALRPDIAVTPASRLRLRLVNASSASGLTLWLEAHALWVMAIDGQPAEPFLARDSRVGLGPGNRVDLFVDMSGQAGSTSTLRASPGGEQGILRFVYGAGRHPGDRARPQPLPPSSLPERIDLRSALRAELLLDRDRPGVDSPPLFSVRRGRSVTLTLRQSSAVPRVVHVHGHHFRLLDRLDDGWKPYWLDTLVVGERTERVAFVADNPGRWLIQGRSLEQPASMVAVWFAVT